MLKLVELLFDLSLGGFSLRFSKIDKRCIFFLLFFRVRSRFPN